MIRNKSTKKPPAWIKKFCVERIRENVIKYLKVMQIYALSGFCYHYVCLAEPILWTCCCRSDDLIVAQLRENHSHRVYDMIGVLGFSLFVAGLVECQTQDLVVNRRKRIIW